MTVEHVNPIRNIGKRIAEIGARHGLAVRYFSVVPNLEDPDGPDRVQIGYELDNEKKDDQIKLEQADSAIADAFKAAEKEALEKRAEEVRGELEEDLKKKLQNGGGFIEGMS